MNTTILNFVGGPGSGKTGMATETFSYLRRNKVLAEYVPEYAKELCWTNRALLLNQPLISGEQLRRLDLYIGKVNYVVTDSPLLLSAFWAKLRGWRGLSEDLLEINKKYRNIYFFVDGMTEMYYETSGRGEDWNTAKKLHDSLELFLLDSCTPFTVIPLGGITQVIERLNSTL